MSRWNSLNENFFKNDFRNIVNIHVDILPILIFLDGN